VSKFPGGAGETAFGEVDRFLLPLGDRSVLLWFLEHLFVVHGRRDRLRRALAKMGVAGPLFQRLWRLGHGNGGGQCLVVEGGKPGSGDAARLGELAPILGGLLEEGPEWLLGEDPLGMRRPLRGILLHDYQGIGRERLVLFYFPHGSVRPEAVLKLRTATAPGRSLRREREALEAVRERLSEPMRRSLPVPLGYRSTPSLEALMLSSVPGVPLYVETFRRLAPRRAAARHLRSAAAWLARFHRETASPGSAFDPAEGEGWIREALPAAGGGLPDWYERLLEDCAATPVPAVARHGDYWSRNLLLERAGDVLPGVVDWEQAGGQAPPLEDLFHFPLAYGLDFPWRRGRRSAPEAAFRRTFLRENTVSRHVRDYFRRYCRETGLPEALLGPLFRYHLLDRRARAAGRESDRPTTSDLWPWMHFYQMLEQADRSVFSG